MLHVVYVSLTECGDSHVIYTRAHWQYDTLHLFTYNSLTWDLTTWHRNSQLNTNLYNNLSLSQVDRYKQLLLKQRDIMIALTQRLNERDEQIMALQVRRA